MSREFVVLNEHGGVIDAVDPYVSHYKEDNVFFVKNNKWTYKIVLEEDQTYEIREMRNDNE